MIPKSGNRFSDKIMRKQNVRQVYEAAKLTDEIANKRPELS
jgi:hypothetical protein